MRSQLLLVALTALAAFAQTGRGTITGTVSDPAKAVIANATVEAKNTATAQVYSGASSTTGNYTIAQLPVGTYELNITVPGFKKYVRPGIVIEVSRDRSRRRGAGGRFGFGIGDGHRRGSVVEDRKRRVELQLHHHYLNDLPVFTLSGARPASATRADSVTFAIPWPRWS